MGVNERFQILDGHTEFSTDPNGTQFTPMNPAADCRFTDFQKPSDLMRGHERFAQHRAVGLNT